MNRIYFSLLVLILFSLSTDLQAQTYESQQGDFYISSRFAKKDFLHSDKLVRTLSPADRGFYGGLGLGYYFSDRLAFEIGGEYYSFYLFTPFDVAENPDYDAIRYNILSIPISIRYDYYKNNNVKLYGKSIFSTDHRLNASEASNGTFPNPNEATIDISNNALIFNAGIETGVDIEIVKGIRIGTFVNLNYAFTDSAVLEYDKLDASQQPFTEQLNLNNTHLGFGIELKIGL